MSYDVVRNGIILHTVDNSWVVPYNAFLLQKCNAHINIEVCSSISSVKYMYRYVLKGHDKVMATLRAEQPTDPTAPRIIDEISEFVDAR